MNRTDAQDAMVTQSEVLEAVLTLRRSFLPDSLHLDLAINSAASDGTPEAVLMALLSSKDFRKRFANLFAGIDFAYAAPIVEADAAPEILKKLFDRTAREWERLGEQEPAWSVLSADAYKKTGAGTVPPSFYVSGENEAKRLIGALRRNGYSPPFKTGVEYGCGIGRVSIPLSRFCEALYAYDISNAHLAMAEHRAKECSAENIKFTQISHPGQQLQSGYDLYYSALVFQHNPPPVISRLIRQALEGLSPGGVAVFQLPVFMNGYQFRLNDYLSRDRSGIEMHVLPQRAVLDLVSSCGCRLIDLFESSQNLRDRILSNIFTVQKPAEA